MCSRRRLRRRPMRSGRGPLTLVLRGGEGPCRTKAQGAGGRNRRPVYVPHRHRPPRGSPRRAAHLHFRQSSRAALRRPGQTGWSKCSGRRSVTASCWCSMEASSATSRHQLWSIAPTQYRVWCAKARCPGVNCGGRREDWRRDSRGSGEEGKRGCWHTSMCSVRRHSRLPASPLLSSDHARPLRLHWKHLPQSHGRSIVA